MSVKEVTSLRKSGKLRDAYKMAIEDFNEDKYDSWTQMSLFWVLRDICQQIFLPNNNIENAKKCLNQMLHLLPTMMDDNGAGERTYMSLYKKIQPGAELISNASELSKTDAVSAYNNVRKFADSTNELDSPLHEDLGWIIYRYIKARISELRSIEVRTLLRDYMNLHNERPSMLHSQMLNFALSFSKGHSDFSFYRFFLLWGPKKLRSDDLQKGYYNGSDIPSLISRICKQFVESGENIDVEILCNKIELSRSEILDLLREPQFWGIMNLHKEDKNREAFEAFAIYNKKNTSLGPSHWNSEVLKIAERFMDEQDSWRFIYFFKAWNYENLIDTDWKEEKDDKGNTYKPLAVKAAKKCYEFLKNMQQRDVELVNWLSSYFDVVIERAEKDEWTLRQRGIIYVWQQQYSHAINVYKSLLLELSDKYYIWSELATCIRDNNELKIGLLSKSLLLEHKEEFLGNIHLLLAGTLLQERMKAEALFELNSYKIYREKEGKGLTAKYNDLIQQIGFLDILPESNKSLYVKYASKAEEYAFSEIEAKEITLVDRWENEGKTRCTFTDGETVTFQVNAKQLPFLLKAKFGTVYSVKCHEEQVQSGPYSWNKSTITETIYVPLCMFKLEKKLWTGLPQKFGYVENI
jgi:hypothetical protein